MINIDWSYAPCGATHFHKGDIMYRPHWRKSGFYCDLGLEAFGWIKDTYPSPISECIERPKKQEAWDGDGLPPVGTVCEYKKKDSNYRQGLVSVSVLFYGREKCLLLHSASSNEFVEDISSVEFRPIKTAEQLEEEEKKQAIDDMQRIYEESMLDYSSRLGHASRPAIKALYEAGYRKQ